MRIARAKTKKKNPSRASMEAEFKKSLNPLKHEERQGLVLSNLDSGAPCRLRRL